MFQIYIKIADYIPKKQRIANWKIATNRNSVTDYSRIDIVF